MRELVRWNTMINNMLPVAERTSQDLSHIGTLSRNPQVNERKGHHTRHRRNLQNTMLRNRQPSHHQHTTLVMEADVDVITAETQTISNMPALSSSLKHHDTQGGVQTRKSQPTGKNLNYLLTPLLVTRIKVLVSARNP